MSSSPRRWFEPDGPLAAVVPGRVWVGETVIPFDITPGSLRIDGPIGVTTAELAAGLDIVSSASSEYALFMRGTLESACDRMGMPRRCLDEVVRDDET